MGSDWAESPTFDPFWPWWSGLRDRRNVLGFLYQWGPIDLILKRHRLLSHWGAMSLKAR